MRYDFYTLNNRIEEIGLAAFTYELLEQLKPESFYNYMTKHKMIKLDFSKNRISLGDNIAITRLGPNNVWRIIVSKRIEIPGRCNLSDELLMEYLEVNLKLADTLISKLGFELKENYFEFKFAHNKILFVYKLKEYIKTITPAYVYAYSSIYLISLDRQINISTTSEKEIHHLTMESHPHSEVEDIKIKIHSKTNKSSDEMLEFIIDQDISSVIKGQLLSSVFSEEESVLLSSILEKIDNQFLSLGFKGNIKELFEQVTSKTASSEEEVFDALYYSRSELFQTDLDGVTIWIRALVTRIGLISISPYSKDVLISKDVKNLIEAYKKEMNAIKYSGVQVGN